MLPLKSFDLEVFPFIVVQVKSGLFLINAKDKKVTDLGPVTVRS